ncbi:MAG TPA: hypothetical protein VNQ77_10375 [Frankiaceae bacterium]|nr:hypothetical protein [Frankiaceae bacterium]
MTRTLVAIAVAGAVALTGVPADAAKRKPVTRTYDVLLPVPYPVEGEGGVHCAEGIDGLSRDLRKFTLPAAVGQLKVTLSGFKGDWVVEIYDAKGRVLGYGAELNLTSGTRQASYKKKRSPKETVTIAVCNLGGTPQGKVVWTFTYA